MTPMQAAISARVSSAHQAEAPTIARQVAALRERVAADGLPLPAALPCMDEGSSGATLVRPALERRRDLVAAGAVDRLYGHSPDRLARTYASQVVLVDALQRAGVEVIFVHRALGQSPEDDLLLQVQGLMAEDERAKLVARHRRGKRHAARAGTVHGLAGAPYGYRDVAKHDGGGYARDEVIAEAAWVSRQMVAWGGRDRATRGDVGRRLSRAGVVTRTGKTVWDRRVVWGMLKNPASRGTAMFGKTRQGPLRPRLRAQRGRRLQPRRAVSSSAVPHEAWRTIPVPALVEADTCAAVQAQWRANQRHARQSRRGALDLLPGLGPCQPCGDACYGQRLSPKAAKGHPRAYAYDRCLGTDAYRCGGDRVCRKTQVRTDLWDLAVWREVCGLLAHPERRAAAYGRRLQPHEPARGTAYTRLEAQLGKLRQGLARLIDSDAEGLLEHHAFEPRIARLRQRLTHLEAQRQQLAAAAAMQTALPLIIGRLEDCAARVQAGLEEADWPRHREMIRALVTRVEVDHGHVHVVFRVDQQPGDLDAEKKSLQDCRGSPLTAAGAPAAGRVRHGTGTERAPVRPRRRRGEH